MATYFDKREKREKPVPDCGAVGLVWDEQTQRCEPRGLVRTGRSLPAQAQGWPFENVAHVANEHSGDGMGFLGPAVATGSVAGPIGAVVGAIVGAIGSLFGFGGGDDQATTYRPPSNTAQLCVSFSDARGAESVAYDMSQLGAAIANGNRDVDLYSYYSAFVSGRVDMGASEAAARVIQDAARVNNVSISRAADMILNVAGVPRLACAGGFLPPPDGGSSGLPGYCPPGTYHPYPIGDPRQNVCEPFPESYLAAQIARQMEIQRQAQQQQQAQTGTGTQTGTATGATGAPSGMWLNPATGRYEPIPQCPQGSVFDPRVGQCVSGSGGGLFDGDLFSGSNLWIWLLIAAGVIYATGGGDDRPEYRRAKR